MNHKRYYKWGCLTLNFERNNWRETIRQLVHEEDLYNRKGYGYENSPHCTILSGFNDDINIFSKIKKYLICTSEINIKTDTISIFESGFFDVVKYDVNCEMLMDLNKTIRSNVECKIDFLIYNPHITIAYAKKGNGNKYLMKLNESIVFKPVNYSFLHPDGKIDIITI